jgi:hypothetical protein
VTNLYVAIVASALGMAYMMYGRRQAKFAPVIAGLLLCVYPYFLDSLLWLCVVGVLLAAAPFVFDF